MIKNLKYRLGEFLTSRRVRIGGIAIILAFTVAAVTLHGCPIHTVDILAGHISLNRGFYSSNNLVPTKTSYPVFITNGAETTQIDFQDGTVAEALIQAGINADDDDFVEPSLTSVITETTYIDYAKVDYVNGSYKETIAFDTEIVYSS